MRRSGSGRELSLKVLWRKPPEGGVGTERVVEALNVAEDVRLGLSAGSVALEMDELTLETAEEILSHSIVVRIALAGHALVDVGDGESAPIGVGGILGAPVAVENQARLCPLPADGHLQSRQGQLGVDSAGEGA